MKKLIAFAVAALVAGAAFAAITDLVNSYVIVNGAYWDASGQGHDAFHNGNLGNLYSLTLGGETTVKVSDDPHSWADGWSYDLMNWKVTTTADPEEAAIISGKVNLGTTEIYDDSFKTKNDGVAVADFSTLTDNESYKLQVWYGISGDNESVWDSNNSANYVASFTKTAVPEPATMSLLGLGALAMVLRRKLRK